MDNLIPNFKEKFEGKKQYTLSDYRLIGKKYYETDLKTLRELSFLLGRDRSVIGKQFKKAGVFKQRGCNMTRTLPDKTTSLENAYDWLDIYQTYYLEKRWSFIDIAREFRVNSLKVSQELSRYMD